MLYNLYGNNLFSLDVPQISAAGITIATHGDMVSLECVVDAHPEPKMMFWRDHSGRVPVIQGGQFDIHVDPVKDVSLVIELSNISEILLVPRNFLTL